MVEQLTLPGMSSVAELTATDPWLEGEAFSAAQVAEAAGMSVGDAERELDLLEASGRLESETAKSGRYRFWRLSQQTVGALGIER